MAEGVGVMEGDAPARSVGVAEGVRVRVAVAVARGEGVPAPRAAPVAVGEPEAEARAVGDAADAEGVSLGAAEGDASDAEGKAEAVRERTALGEAPAPEAEAGAEGEPGDAEGLSGWEPACVTLGECDAEAVEEKEGDRVALGLGVAPVEGDSARREGVAPPEAVAAPPDGLAAALPLAAEGDAAEEKLLRSVGEGVGGADAQPLGVLEARAVALPQGEAEAVAQAEAVACGLLLDGDAERVAAGVSEADAQALGDKVGLVVALLAEEGEAPLVSEVATVALGRVDGLAEEDGDRETLIEVVRELQVEGDHKGLPVPLAVPQGELASETLPKNEEDNDAVAEKVAIEAVARGVRESDREPLEVALKEALKLPLTDNDRVRMADTVPHGEVV